MKAAVRVIVFGLLVCINSLASDPFVGTWLYNAEKSPKPTIDYTIKALGDNRFELIGSDGRPLTIKGDGVAIKSPYGGTVSFRKIDEHSAEMVRQDSGKLERRYSVSQDDKTLTLFDIQTGPGGGLIKLTTKYSRLAPGKGLVGAWQSISMDRQVAGDRHPLVIERFSADGLSFSSKGEGYRLDMNFDGKLYVNKTRDMSKPVSTSGKRVNARLVQTEDWTDGKVDDHEEYRISEDGKTLTEITRPTTSTAVYIAVFDRQ